MPGWLRRWRDRRALASRPIPDELWLNTLSAFPFLKRRALSDLVELRRLSTIFLARKEFHAAGGLELSDEIAVAIAAQACLPILRLGLDLYDDFVGIVVHPDEVVAEREWMDEDGIVHTGEEPLAGEAMPGGPIMLSWQDVKMAGDAAPDGYNVVIHEFVHVLDMRSGAADGTPPLPDRAWYERWQRVMGTAHAALCAEIERGEEPLLDPYASNGLEEFFPVASEAFFVAPRRLHEAHAEVYELLKDYFGQDPIRYLPD